MSFLESLVGVWCVGSCEAPFIWSRVPKTTLPTRQLYVICEKVVSVGRVKVDHTRTAGRIIHNLYQIFKCSIIPLLLSFLRSLITVDFAELIFTSLIQISASNPKSRHYVTLATPRVALGRRVKVFIWGKVVLPARVTLPAEARQLDHPSCLTPQDRFTILT